MHATVWLDESPSEEQRYTAPLWQYAVLGVQSWAEHAPPEQYLLLAEQSTEESALKPSGEQVTIVLGPEHSVAPGVQTQVLQLAPAVPSTQVSRAPHATGPVQASPRALQVMTPPLAQ